MIERPTQVGTGVLLTSVIEAYNGSQKPQALLLEDALTLQMCPYRRGPVRLKTCQPVWIVRVSHPTYAIIAPITLRTLVHVVWNGWMPNEHAILLDQTRPMMLGAGQ